MASLDSVLLALIVDHCTKKGWHAAADRLRADAREKGFHGINLPPAFCDGPNSFLTDWFGIFWGFFRKRSTSSYSHSIGVQLEAALGRPAQLSQQAPDRGMNFNRPTSHSAPFQNGYNRPPHHPNNPRAAVAASVQRTPNTPVTHGVPRRGPTPPFGVMPQGFPMHSAQPDMNDAFRMMTGNSSSSPQTMNALRQMRQRPATTSPAYRPGPPTPTRRSTAETSSHMQPKNLDHQRPAPMTAPVAMASKKRSSSANVSLDSIPTPSGVMSSASLAVYGKNATAHPQSNAPKKRMRNSTGYPENLPQMIPMASHRQSQNMMQTRIQAAQQQTAEMQSHRMQAMGMRPSQQQQQQQQQLQQQQRMQQILLARAQNKQSNTQNGSRGSVSVPPGGGVGKTENMVIGKNDAPGTSAALSMDALGLLGNETSAGAGSQVNSGNNDAFLFQTMQQPQQQAANGNPAAAAAAAASIANSRNNSRTSPQTRQRPNMGVRSKKGVAANNRVTESSQSSRPSAGVVVGSIPSNGPSVVARDGYNVTSTPRENPARAASAPGASGELISRAVAAAAANGRKTETAGLAGGVEQDKQASGGGGTPSQRSGVSGVSGGAANKRPAKGATQKRRARRGGKKGASSPDAPKKSVPPQPQQQPQPPPPQPPPPPPPAATQPEQRKKEGASAIHPDFPLELDGSFMMTGGEEFAMLDMGAMGGMNASLGLDSATGFEDQSFDGV